MTPTTQDQEIPLPHGVGAVLETIIGTIHVNVFTDNGCALCLRWGGPVSCQPLTPAERRWLADELLHGLEDGDAE